MEISVNFRDAKIHTPKENVQLIVVTSDLTIYTCYYDDDGYTIIDGCSIDNPKFWAYEHEIIKNLTQKYER